MSIPFGGVTRPSSVVPGQADSPQHASANSPRLRNAAGYTLIELLTVVVLIGILSGMAVPHINVNHYRVDGAMHTLGTSLLGAQRLAVQKQHNIIIAFDVENARIRIHEDANNDGLVGDSERVRYEQLAEGVVFGRGSAPPHSRIGEKTVSFSWEQDGLPAIRFHRNGSANEEGGFYLTSRRAADSGKYSHETRALTIERATGRTSWFSFGSSWERRF